MISVCMIQFIIIGGIWSVLYVTQTARKKKDKEFYEKQIQRAMLVGDTKMAERYIKILSGIR